MSRDFIRLGDPTSHGGSVIGATSQMTIDGIPVALMGDPCSCPINGHNNCTIAEGDRTITFEGRPVALSGHKTTCGAVLSSAAPGKCSQA